MMKTLKNYLQTIITILIIAFIFLGLIYKSQLQEISNSNDFFIRPLTGKQVENPKFSHEANLKTNLNLIFDKGTNPKITNHLGYNPWTVHLSRKGNYYDGILTNKQLIFYGDGELEQNGNHSWVHYSGYTFSTEFQEILFLNLSGKRNKENRLKGEFNGAVKGVFFSGSFTSDQIAYK